MRIGEVSEREVPRGLAAFIREVRAIVNGGFRFDDQTRVVTARFLSTQAPILLDASTRRPPRALLCLSMAETRGDVATKITGAAIAWRFSQDGIYIEDIEHTIPGVEYEIAVAIVEG